MKSSEEKIRKCLGNCRQFLAILKKFLETVNTYFKLFLKNKRISYNEEPLMNYHASKSTADAANELYQNLEGLLQTLTKLKPALFQAFGRFSGVTAKTLKGVSIGVDELRGIVNAEQNILTRLQSLVKSPNETALEDRLKCYQSLVDYDAEAHAAKDDSPRYLNPRYQASIEGPPKLRKFLRRLFGGHWKVVDFIKSNEYLNIELKEETNQLISALKGIKLFDVFICYSRDDEKYVRLTLEKIRKPLETAHMGFWWDRDELYIGDNWDKKIQETIENVDIGMIFLSSNLLKSSYVKEVEAKLIEEKSKKGMKIFPIVVHGGVLSKFNDTYLNWIKEIQIGPKDPDKTGLKELQKKPLIHSKFCKELAQQLIMKMDELTES